MIRKLGLKSFDSKVMNHNLGFKSKLNQSLIIVLRLKTAFVVGCLKFCKQTEGICSFTQ